MILLRTFAPELLNSSMLIRPVSTGVISMLMKSDVGLGYTFKATRDSVDSSVPVLFKVPKSKAKYLINSRQESN